MHCNTFKKFRRREFKWNFACSITTSEFRILRQAKARLSREADRRYSNSINHKYDWWRALDLVKAISLLLDHFDKQECCDCCRGHYVADGNGQYLHNRGIADWVKSELESESIAKSGTKTRQILDRILSTFQENPFVSECHYCGERNPKSESQRYAPTCCAA